MMATKRLCSGWSDVLFRLGLLSSLLSANVQVLAGAPSDDEVRKEYFLKNVVPVLQKHCSECHSHQSGKAKGGLVLDTRSGWEKGGDSGPSVVPGKPEESLLIAAVRYRGPEMPPTGKLSDEEIGVLERWVADGAFDPRTTAANAGPASSDMESRRSHWAFQPLTMNSVPDVRDSGWSEAAVDRFILSKLEARGLHPVSDADRYTWLRRVCLDLTGLPPTVEQIEQFIGDESPEARKNVVDRLLKTRSFGERWGRHWLDLTGFADQIGTANDVFAEHAWRYRDYVIDSYNKDKPFDQFIREQLAGDLLPFESADQRAEQLTATGFLLLGDLTIVEADKAKLQIDVVDQQLDKVGRAFLAMTIGCARCHDHKFDPIPQDDYYALAGILNSTQSVHKAAWGVWSFPTEVVLPETELQRAERMMQTVQHQQRLEVLRQEQSKLQASNTEIDAAIQATEATLSQAALTARNAARSEGDAATGTGEGAGADSTSLSTTVSLLKKLRDAQSARLRKLNEEVQHAVFFAPKPPRAFAVQDVAEPADMKVTIRGNAHALGKTVPRGFLSVIGGEPVPNDAAETSGRRELAAWLVSEQNPLTTRVVVNRIWQKLFGEGIVSNVDYFGLPGEHPTHPELLDYLAQRFMVQGWSQKQLIRELVLSRTYGLSSIEGNNDAQKADPENRLLWRMNRRRLDAEALRDSLLMVSGRLIDSDGGPALPLEYPENSGSLDPAAVNPPFFRLGRFRPEQHFERTVYLPIVRSAPQSGPGELRNVFDFTQPAEFSGQRSVTSVPTQALFLMNSTMMSDTARALAERVLESPGEDRQRLEFLWLRTLGRPIEESELSESIAFLEELRRGLLTATDAGSELKCWSQLCHALLASNEFLMRL